MNQFLDTKARYLEKYSYLHPTDALLGTHGRSPRVVYPCPSCGVSLSKDAAGIKRTDKCPSCTRAFRSTRFTKVAFLHPTRFISGDKTHSAKIEYPCPACGGLVIRSLNHLVHDNDTYFCRECYSRYVGIFYDSGKIRCNLQLWRRKACSHLVFLFLLFPNMKPIILFLGEI